MLLYYNDVELTWQLFFTNYQQEQRFQRVPKSNSPDKLPLVSLALFAGELSQKKLDGVRVEYLTASR